MIRRGDLVQVAWLPGKLFRVWWAGSHVALYPLLDPHEGFFCFYAEDIQGLLRVVIPFRGGFKELVELFKQELGSGVSSWKEAVRHGGRPRWNRTSPITLAIGDLKWHLKRAHSKRRKPI